MNSPSTPEPNQAAQHVADAHRLLKALQAELAHHPELDDAIRKLELALSALTIQTGGLF
jgi:hypothetical protein